MTPGLQHHAAADVSLLSGGAVAIAFSCGEGSQTKPWLL